MEADSLGGAAILINSSKQDAIILLNPIGEQQDTPLLCSGE